jgi:hypothetical protein
MLKRWPQRGGFARSDKRCEIQLFPILMHNFKSKFLQA